jgi:hypothetical protein
MGGMLLPALLLAIPLIAMHFYARAERTCPSPFERDQFPDEELPKELKFFATKTKSQVDPHRMK